MSLKSPSQLAAHRCSHSAEQAVIVLNDELTVAEIVKHFRERKQILLLHYATGPFLTVP